MKRRLHSANAPLVLLLAGLAACGSGSTNAPAPSATSGAGPAQASAASAALAAPLTPLPELADQAHVAHRGERLVELFDASGRRTLAYREAVASDGEGGFSLRTLEALTPVPQDWLPRQWNREGYLFRYRDFAIRRPAWFQANYTVTGPDELGLAAEPVADRPVERYRIERRTDAGESLSYELWVDRASRLPLRIEERGPKNALRSRVQYESLELEPALADVVWFRGAHDERVLDAGADLAEQVGRPVPTPRLLPAGFRLHEASTLQDRGTTWVKLTYSDGADTFFFLHRPSATEGERTSPRSSPNAAGEGPGGLVLPESRSAGDLFLHRLGAAGAAQATLDSGTYLAVGKVTDDELVDAIESALP